jgi:glyoxylase-like metal-dependent hydrolase (beta-lactamase superfamily II)
MPKIPLEDGFTDILGKAQRGLELSDAELASRAGASMEDVARVKGGEVDEPLLRKLAQVLHLGPDTLVDSARNAWYPRPHEPTGLIQFNTVWQEMTVNAYLIWDSVTKEAAVFDTGADCSPVLQMIKANGLAVKGIFLTHTHADHIADLARLKAEVKAPAHVSRLEATEGAAGFTEGQSFRIGNLKIDTRQTSGHSRGGTTYLVSGLAKPLAVVGDAMFAGSMGGGLVSYAEALENNRKKILTLPEDTVLCPGHGPLTSVEEEKRHNPFFPEFQTH